MDCHDVCLKSNEKELSKQCAVFSCVRFGCRALLWNETRTDVARCGCAVLLCVAEVRREERVVAWSSRAGFLYFVLTQTCCPGVLKPLTRYGNACISDACKNK